MSLVGGILCLLAGFALSLWQGSRGPVAAVAGMLEGMGIALIPWRSSMPLILGRLPLERRMPLLRRMVVFAVVLVAGGFLWVLLGVALKGVLPFAFYGFGPVPGTDLRFCLAGMYVGFWSVLVLGVLLNLLRRP